jgi:hypothetical protein
VTPLPIAFLLLLSSPVSAERRAVRACDLAEQRTALFRRAAIAPSAGTVTSVFPALFAANGFLLAPGPISARGPASVAQILGRDSLNSSSRLRVQTIGGDVSRDGNDGFTYGYFDTFRASGDSVIGWYHAYWRRDGGDWKMLALVRRRRPPGEMTRPQPLVTLKDARCVEPPRSRHRRAAQGDHGDRCRLLRLGGDERCRGVCAFAADDAAKSGKNRRSCMGGRHHPAVRSPPPNGLKWNPEIRTASRSGDFQFQVGSASVRVAVRRSPQNPATAGHYFTIWRRDGSGRWRWVID